MQENTALRPLVLVIAGHDPTGAAGVQADIESVIACGALCASLITATTAQNTMEFAALTPQPATDFRVQARLLVSDMTFSACKIGLLGDVGIARCVDELLADLDGLPVVLDPVLATGTGAGVADRDLLDFIRGRLVPRATILTPNGSEARRLTGAAGIEEAGRALLAMGAGNVLVTGTDEQTPLVVNHLFRPRLPALAYEYPRLPHVYHGSGCTLSAAIASFLALGQPPESAVRMGQDFTWRSLRNGNRLGQGQLHPRRYDAAADKA